MQKENRDRDIQPFPENAGSENADAREPALPEDFLRMMEWIRRAQAEAERVRLHAEPAWDDIKR